MSTDIRVQRRAFTNAARPRAASVELPARIAPTGGVRRLRRVTGVVLERQTWRNMLWLLLAVPLGVLYCGAVLGALALGAGLLVVVLGAPAMLWGLQAPRRLAALDRRAVARLLRWELAPDATGESSRPVSAARVRDRLRACLDDPATWKGFGYIMLKLPFGLVSLALVLLLAAAGGALLAAPLVWGLRGTTMVAALLGIPVGLGSLHVANALAAASGRLARSMLAPAPVRVPRD